MNIPTVTIGSIIWSFIDDGTAEAPASLSDQSVAGLQEGNGAGAAQGTL